MTAAASPVEMSATMVTTATMEMPTTAEGKANRRPIPIVVGIRLKVRLRVIAIPAQTSAAMPMAAMAPTTTTAAVVDLCHIRGGRLKLQASQATRRPR